MKSCRPELRPSVGAGILAALGLSLAGCSSDQSNDYGQVFQIFTHIFNSEDDRVTYQQAAGIPFSTIGVRVGDSTEGILVLGSSNGDEQLWTAASHIVLVMRHGRVVRTAGLEYNLSEMRLVRGSVAGTLPSAETLWEADFPDQHLYSVQVSCKAYSGGADTYSNFNSPVRVIKVIDECRSDQIDWSFTNTYWIAPQTGLMWHSIQNINPKLDPLELRILRPPG
jgi:hypothetical protein